MKPAWSLQTSWRRRRITVIDDLGGWPDVFRKGGYTNFHDTTKRTTPRACTSMQRIHRLGRLPDGLRMHQLRIAAPSFARCCPLTRPTQRPVVRLLRWKHQIQALPGKVRLPLPPHRSQQALRAHGRRSNRALHKADTRGMERPRCALEEREDQGASHENPYRADVRAIAHGRPLVEGPKDRGCIHGIGT